MRELLREQAARLREAGFDQADADARILLAHVLKVERSSLLTVDEVSDEDAAAFREVIETRLAGTPVQHITGKAPFRYTEVEVGPGVLIPRPETEWMTGWAIEQLRDRESRVVVELCAGSGAISKSISTELDNTDVYANELDDDAYQFLVKNLNWSPVVCAQGDMAEAFPALDHTVDLVVANPPYIAESAYESLPVDVREHDPKVALVADDDGLAAIRVVVDTAARLLKRGGLLVCEHGDDQADAVVDILTAQGEFTDIVDHLDLNDRPRFVSAVRGPDKPTWQKFDVTTEQEQAIAAAVAAVRAGECIVLPTDTVYGIGADAGSAAAVQRLLDAKQRGRDMPPPVLIAEPAMLGALAAEVPEAAQALAESCWPGALTLILTAQPGLRMDLGDTDGTIAVRVPDHEFARDLLRRTGPLAVSSANVSGQPASTRVTDAIAMLGNEVSVYLDDGATPGSVASTIVDFVGRTEGRIVRQGVISVEQIRQVAPEVEEPDETDGESPEETTAVEVPDETVVEALDESVGEQSHDVTEAPTA